MAKKKSKKKSLKDIEKTLGVNGGSPYLPKGGEPGFDPKIK